MSTEPTRTTKSKRKNGRRVTPKTEQPASQRVEAPPCQVCPPDKRSDTYVYATRGRKRYCKCKRCGWTWGVAFEEPDAVQTR